MSSTEKHIIIPSKLKIQSTESPVTSHVIATQIQSTESPVTSHVIATQIQYQNTILLAHSF
jgi:hypothetical protein